VTDCAEREWFRWKEDGAGNCRAIVMSIVERKKMKGTYI